MKLNFIYQNRRQSRRIERVGTDVEFQPRRAQHHHKLIKQNIVDGCTSSTSLFDSECGDVPSVFDPTKSRLDLADELMRAGHQRQAQKVAIDGIQSQAD